MAICEQIGEPVPGRIVQREITQIISAGTVSDLHDAGCQAEHTSSRRFSQDGEKNSGFAFVDLTTGDFRLTEFADDRQLRTNWPACSRRRCCSATSRRRDSATLPGGDGRADGYAFLHDQAHFTLREHFKVQSLDGFGCAGMRAGRRRGGRDPALPRQRIAAADRRTSGGCSLYATGEFMIVDAAAQANLELVHSRARTRHHAARRARSHASRRWARASCATGFCIRCAISVRCARGRK